jgi:hypothetical protein
MPSKIATLLQNIKKQTKNSSMGSSDLSAIKESVEELKIAVSLMAIQSQIAQLSDIIEKLTETTIKPTESKINSNTTSPSSNLTENLKNLKDFATVRLDHTTKTTQILLHRPTEDFEYQNSARKENIYETTKETTWLAEFPNATNNQKANNPVVSVWVPEKDIVKITGAKDNTGIWGDLGKNPHSQEYKIHIKPGKYELYMELRQ